MTEKGYLLRNQQPEAGERLNALASLFDGSSIRHMESLGLAPGWNCWEAGAGGPSLVRMMAERVWPRRPHCRH